MGIKSPCFPRPWILLCPSGKAPLPRRQRVTQGFFCPAAHSGAGGRTSACQVRRPPAAGTAHLDGAGSSGLCRQQTPRFHRGGREEFDRKYTWAARAAQPGDSRLRRRWWGEMKERAGRCSWLSGHAGGDPRGPPHPAGVTAAGGRLPGDGVGAAVSLQVPSGMSREGSRGERSL